jgi:microcompartment protein CcmL/EutN
MPRPIRPIGDIVSVHAITDDAPAGDGSRPRAMGLIETFGIVYVLEAADAMLKTADVELIGYENVASGYISVLVQGDVAACQAAVAAGVKAVQAMGTDVYSSVVIPTPHPDVAKITARYALENLLP